MRNTQIALAMPNVFGLYAELEFAEKFEMFYLDSSIGAELSRYSLFRKMPADNE